MSDGGGGDGAWGLGLFQSDFDHDHIQDLTWEAGLLELEQADAKKQGKKAIYAEELDRMRRERLDGQNVRVVEHDRADESKIQRKDDEIYYSIYANLCSSPKRARQHLEKTKGRPGKVSILQRMITKHQDLANSEKDSPKRPGYVYVLLAACAMSLGCELPSEFLTYFRGMYAHRTRVGLMRDALQQVSKALYGPEAYKNDGTPYDFGTKGVDYTMKSGGSPKKDRYVPYMINVPSPSGIHPERLLQPALMLLSGQAQCAVKTKQDLDKKFDESVGELKEYGYDVCGGCGGEDGEYGKALIACSTCQGRLYCGKECRKKDWMKHKEVCKAVLG